MVVQHNMQAANANRMLNLTVNGQQKSTEKLSSGYRINRAADDAAGLAISEKMRSQIRGLDRASTNAQDGISVVQTAEGALNEVHSMLQRMNELATQAANDTNTTNDRKEIQLEVDQLTSEIDRVASTTQFNTMNLLDGSFTGKNLQVGSLSGQTIRLDIGKMDSEGLGIGGKVTTTTAAKPFTHGTITLGTAGVNKADAATTKTGPAIFSSGQGVLSTAGTYVTDNGTTWHLDGDLKKTNVTIKLASTVKANPGAKFTVEASTKNAMNISGIVDKSSSIAIENIHISDDDLKTASDGTYTWNGKAFTDKDGNTLKGVTINDGANDIPLTSLATNSSIKLDGFKAEVAAKTTTTGGLDVTTHDHAEEAMSKVQDAIDHVSSQRATLGAVQNRLEHTIANLDTTSENTQAAESRIRDTDMAKEMVTWSKNNILAQAGQSMLAQANQSNQGVLSLLQ